MRNELKQCEDRYLMRDLLECINDVGIVGISYVEYKENVVEAEGEFVRFVLGSQGCNEYEIVCKLYIVAECAMCFLIDLLQIFPHLIGKTLNLKNSLP